MDCKDSYAMSETDARDLIRDKILIVPATLIKISTFRKENILGESCQVKQTIRLIFIVLTLLLVTVTQPRSSSMRDFESVYSQNEQFRRFACS